MTHDIQYREFYGQYWTLIAALDADGVRRCREVVVRSMVIEVYDETGACRNRDTLPVGVNAERLHAETVEAMKKELGVQNLLDLLILT